MIGIIYKFTIVAKYKMDGYSPFYVGQHWEKGSVQHFLKQNKSNYPGSGSIWNDFLNKLKQDYPKYWTKFIRREILCIVNNKSHELLNKLEQYFIKKEKAHYSYCLGGCNVLWGGDNHNVDERTRKKISETKKKWFSENDAPWKGRKMSQEQKDYLRKINTGKYVSEETKLKISISHADFSGCKNPNYGHGERISGDKNPMKNPEVARKNAELRRGKKRTDEQRRKISEAKKGKHLGADNANYGHKWTSEMKLRMSLKKRGLFL